MKRETISIIFYVLVLSSLAVLTHGYPNVPVKSPSKNALPQVASGQNARRSRNLVAALNHARENAYSKSVTISDEESGESKQNIHKRNLGTSENLRKHPIDQAAVENVNLEVDTGEQKPKLHKRNLVGISENLRNHPILEVDSGERQPKLHKRNLVGISENLRKHPIDQAAVENVNLEVDSGEQKPKLHKRNLVGISENLRTNPSLEVDSVEQKPKLHKRNLVGISENLRNHPILEVDSGERQPKLHKRNLVGISENLRKHPIDQAAVENVNLEVDSGEQKPKLHKRNLVGISENLRTNPSLEVDSVEQKPKLHKRNLVGISENLRKNPRLEVDSGEQKPKLHKRNLVGISENLRKHPIDQAAVENVNLEVDSGEQKPQLHKRNLAVISKSLRDASDDNGKAEILDFDLEVDAGEPKKNRRRAATNLVSRIHSHREMPPASAADIDEEQPDIDEDDFQDLQPRGFSSDYGADSDLFDDIESKEKNYDSPRLIGRNSDTSSNDKQKEKKHDSDNLLGKDSDSSSNDDPKEKKHDGKNSDSSSDDEPKEKKHDGKNSDSSSDDEPKEKKHDGKNSDSSSNDDPKEKKHDGKNSDSSSDDEPKEKKHDGKNCDSSSDDEPKEKKHDGKNSDPSSTDEPKHSRNRLSESQKEDDQLKSEDDNNSEADVLPAVIKEEKLLEGENDKDVVSDEMKVDDGYSLAQEDQHSDDLAEDTETVRDPSFTLFTIANTEIGIEFAKVPYRERYLWDKRDAPCHSFSLKVPDETEEKSMITLCIFRPTLEFPDETKLFILNSGSEDANPPQQSVFGFVMNTAISSVYGRIVDKFFYGEVSIYDTESKTTSIFVVEEINLLNKLMRNNQKTLKHMLMVMHGKGKENDKMHTVYNAVVTKGASLIDFMVFTNPTDINRNSFLMFSTNHNSYICPGEPVMQVDENGQIEIESGSNKIIVENDGSVRMLTKEKVYTFRPHGRTIVSKGMETKTLQEHEGSVAISAFTSTSNYDCVLPTPAFQNKRQGGYVCEVCVAVDDLFTKYYIEKYTEDNETSSNYLSRIIDHVSWILRSVDFDEDNKPDNIGLDYDAQSLRWTYPDNANEDITEQDIEVLFQSLGGYDFADCCLGIGYTMKSFPKSEFARRPSETEKVEHPSGVCSGKTGRIPNNLMIISANNKEGDYGAISEDQLVYLTANQIAGAFGASPDGSGDDVCDQFIDDHRLPRHFLMWPDVLRNTTLKEESLSPCSKKDIVKTLSTCRSSCFDVDRHPFCGNGIVEEGEECDCGDEHSCKLQTCCYSRSGKHPCRKSGVGCKSDSASSTLSLAKGLLFFTIGLLTISTQYSCPAL